jgi:hydrogenase maturation protein HypF
LERQSLIGSHQQSWWFTDGQSEWAKRVTRHLTDHAMSQLKRIRFEIRGLVQGVGFRPFIYSLARELRLAGFVGNNSVGVFVEVQGLVESLVLFERKLGTNLPPLARIDSIDSRQLPVINDGSFLIVESQVQVGQSTPVSPDVATCDHCLKELQNPLHQLYELRPAVHHHARHSL